ncbi:4-(cytidine 5'-diphospho)-2-C-methyl-D-erythritol kinase [Ideonella sp. DXS22W]|uniref:4-diphosphocytidyl-2-C-methyl-D-erythritol kinase n=1 Tax=Pseudaquabacterium inlustre TaxID=2984192 RepID=A0ABU9CC31_9BURK
MPLHALYDVPAPAKINLFLHVVGRRPDGYHLLQSVFALIDWCDTLHFERRSDGRLARHDLGPALPADDLSLRAARALQQASGCTLGADISVLKQVPWGAGLGGGSSDAASTLLALNRLWRLHWPRERLAALALPLGADVPFFIGGDNAFVEGIGEQLTPLPPEALPPQWFAVVKPAASIATAAIFSSPLLARATKTAIVMDFLADAKQRGGIESGYGQNDLQPPAESHCSEVTQVAAWLEQRFGNSRMTGSGSAVFARAGTGSQPLANWAADELPPTWVGRMCRSLARHPLVEWAG